MIAFVDLKCEACDETYGYRGDPAKVMPCPRCGHEPGPKEMAADAGEMERFRGLLAARKAYRDKVKAEGSAAAGLEREALQSMIRELCKS